MDSIEACLSNIKLHKDAFTAALFWFLKGTVKVTGRAESQYSVAKFSFGAPTLTQRFLAVLCALALQRRSC